MALDAGLFAQMGVKPRSMGEYRQELDAQAANALALKTGNLGYQNALQAQQDDAAYRDVAKGFGTDQVANYNALMQRGLPKQAQALQATVLGNQKTQAEIGHLGSQTANQNAQAGKNAVDAAQAKLGYGQKVLQSANAPEQVAMLMSQAVQGGIYTQQEAASFLNDMPKDPTQFAQWRDQQAMQGMDIAKKMELQLKTKAEARQSANELMIPDGNGGFRLNEAVVGAKSRIAQSGAMNVSMGTPVAVQMPDGSTAMVQPGNRPGVTPQLMTAPGTNTPLRPAKDPNADKGLTGDQAKANLFGTRMGEADRVINEMESKGVKAPSFAQQMTGGAGIAGAVATAAATPAQQQIDQAQRDFINAVLRRESGAAIAASEFDSARKQYFVQPGDSKEVIAQKTKNRLTATEGMLAEVPESKRGVPSLKKAHAQISGDSEYNALPSGATFVGPDGKTRRKP